MEETEETADKILSVGKMMATPISKPQRNQDADGASQFAAEQKSRREIIEAFRCLSRSANWMDWDKFGPVGWRFDPTDEQLLDHYLRIKKYGGGSICKGLFGDFDLYKYDPQNIPEDKVHRHHNGRMYVFTPVHKLHMNGSRKGKRDTPNGHWKMNASPAPVIEDDDGQPIGTKSSLAFFDKEKRKTRWLMYEFRLVDTVYATQAKENQNMLDRCVLAVIYKAKEDRRDKRDRASLKIRSQGCDEFCSISNPYHTR